MKIAPLNLQLNETMNKNNFDGVRIGLALIVLFAHAYALTLFDQFRILDWIFDSNFAVRGFFAISGYLVTLSYLNSRSCSDYFEKRIRRIYPAYITSIFFCVILGMTISDMNIFDFVASPETIKYLVSNVLFLNFIQPNLPSVFEQHPVQALNGALWTIKVEVMLYCCLPIIVFLFKRIGAIKTTAFLFLFSVTWVLFFRLSFNGVHGEEIARQFPGQLSYFVLGSFFAQQQDNIKLTIWMATIAVITLWFTHQPAIRMVIDPLAYTVIVLYLATNACRNLNFGKYGDLSYGIYLFHFPVIQLCLYLGIYAFSPWLGLLATIVMTLVVAFVSWHFIEKKLLKRNSHYITATTL